MSNAIGAPVVLPSKMPDKISTTSPSWRCVTWREVPGLRRSKSICKSSAHNAKPGGQPSTMPPMAAPCDSPKDVNVNSVPSVLPDMVSISKKVKEF